MTHQRLVERLVLKRRVVLGVDRATYLPRDIDQRAFRLFVVSGAGTDASTIHRSAPQTERMLRDRIGRKRLERRLSSSACTLYVAECQESGRPAGFYWSVTAAEHPLWHDKYEVRPGDALLFNAFVDPDFRRRGVYGLLLAQAHNFLFGELPVARAVTIVEASNVASITANRRFGLRQLESNSLLKFLGVNVLAVYEGSHGSRWHWAPGWRRSLFGPYIP